MLETVGGNMNEKEYSHRLGENRANNPNEITRLDKTLNAADGSRQKRAESWFRNELTVADTELTEMWMEMRM